MRNSGFPRGGRGCCPRVGCSGFRRLPVKSVPFTAKYAGQASTKVDGNTATIAATGTGIATLIGKGKITGAGTGDSSQQPCVPFGGLGSMTGVKGTISYKLTSDARRDAATKAATSSAVTGHAKSSRPPGKLAKAKGILKFTGIYNRDDGTFSVKFTGTLKK